MGKKSIVVELMKKRLTSYGFQYADYEGYRWRFSRELDGLIQSVVIQKSYYGNDYTLEMDNGYWFGRSREITNDPNCNLDFLPFHNEEEQISVLNRLLDVVEQYGLKKLEEEAEEAKKKKKEMEERIFPTPEMYKKLYKENFVLTQKFIKQNNVDELSEEDMLQLLKKELEKMRGEMYVNVQDMLVIFASVYGNMMIKKVGGRWIYTKSNGKTGLDIQLFCWVDILDDFVDAWQKGEENLIIDKYKNSCRPIIDWVRGRRKSQGEDWQPPRAKYRIPPM